ncbi:MAG: hypothetical protein AAGB48_01715 [Planctomycetota bacterium]
MTTRTTCCLFLAATGLLVGGCYSIGGVPASRDAATFESTSHLPATVSVIDTRTQEVIWSIDIPVGQKMRYRFYDKKKAPGATDARPALMRWAVAPTRGDLGSLENELAVPVASNRLVRYDVRESPEFVTSSSFTNQPPPPGINAPASNGVATQPEPIEPAPVNSGSGSPPDLQPIVVEEDR